METKRLSSSSRICFPELTDYCGMAMGASPSGKLQTYSQSLYQSHRPISWFFFFFCAVYGQCSHQQVLDSVSLRLLTCPYSFPPARTKPWLHRESVNYYRSFGMLHSFVRTHVRRRCMFKDSVIPLFPANPQAIFF
jgi:hypothetical protein